MARQHTQEQTAAGLRIGEQIFLRISCIVPVGEVIGGFEVFAAAARNTILRDQVENLLADDRELASLDFCTDTASAANRTQVAKQTEASHVRAGTNKTALSQLCSNSVELSHHRYRFALEESGSDSTFDASGDDASSQRLGEHEQIAGPRDGVRNHAPW